MTVGFNSSRASNSRLIIDFELEKRWTGTRGLLTVCAKGAAMVAKQGDREVLLRFEVKEGEVAEIRAIMAERHPTVDYQLRLIGTKP